MNTTPARLNGTVTVSNNVGLDKPSTGAQTPQHGSKRQVGDLAAALGHCEIAMRRHIDAELADIDLTEAQFRVLRALGSTRRTSADLARACHVTPQAMVGLINALEGKGFITRTRLTGLGRAIATTITPAGRVALDTARRRIKTAEQRLRTNVTSTEHDHLIDLLRQVAVELDRIRTASRRPKRLA